jgi:hypothetical protein
MDGKVRCPKVRSRVPAYFLFPVALYPPLDGTSGGVLREGKLAGNLSRRWRWRATRTNGLFFPRYSGTFSRSTPTSSQGHQRPQFGRKAKSPRPPSVVDKGAGAVVVLGAPSTCAQCGLQNGPGSQIRGAPLPGPSGEQGLVLDQRMPSVGVELGDRTTTRAKARFKLNRDGQQETCLVLGTSLGKPDGVIRPYCVFT